MLNDVKGFGITTSFSYLCIVNELKNIASNVKSNQDKTIS